MSNNNNSNGSNNEDEDTDYTKYDEKYSKVINGKIKELLQSFISGDDGYVYNHAGDCMKKGDIEVNNESPDEIAIPYIEKFITSATDKFVAIRDAEGQEEACTFINALREYITPDDDDYFNMYYFDNENDDNIGTEANGYAGTQHVVKTGLINMSMTEGLFMLDYASAFNLLLKKCEGIDFDEMMDQFNLDFNNANQRSALATRILGIIENMANENMEGGRRRRKTRKAKKAKKTKKARHNKKRKTAKRKGSKRGIHRRS